MAIVASFAGAFNSWDRLPYVTDVRVDAGSTIPAVNDVHNNFIVANYAADGGCLDNDDGSSYYHIHHNFCVYGGHKGDFDGNKKISSDNIHAYPSVYGTTCLNIGAQALPPAGYAEGYYNNKCILPVAGAPYLKLGGIAGPVEDTAGGEWPSTRKHLTCLAGKPGGPEMTAFQAGITLGETTPWRIERAQACMIVWQAPQRLLCPSIFLWMVSLVIFWCCPKKLSILTASAT
eukprot:SAG31_NODE_1943_length_6856_cov_8.165458_4_plen_232_part_00